MLAWFRKRQKVIFYTTMPILALILGLPTIIVSVLGGRREDPYYTAAGEQIKYTTVVGYGRGLQGAYELLLGRDAPRLTAGQILDRMVLLKEAEEAGIEVPIREVAERAREFYVNREAQMRAIQRIRQIDPRGEMERFQLERMFQRLYEDERSRVQFDRQRYEELLGGKAGLTGFEQALREEIWIEKLRDLVSRAGRAEPEAVYDRFVQENRKKKLTVLEIEAAEFVRDVDFVLPQDPRRYYERNVEEFIEPARISMRYVFLPYEQVGVDDPTDEEVQAYFDDRGGEFKDPESGEQRPIEEVRDEIAERLRDGRRVEKSQEILRGVREKVEAEEGDLAAIAREEAGVEMEEVEGLTRDEFRDLPGIGLESVFTTALAEGKGTLGKVGGIFEKGAYLYRVVDAQVSRQKAFSEVEEAIRSDLEAKHAKEYLHYFERNRDRYVAPTRYRLEYIRGPAGEDVAETQKTLADLRKDLEKKRRAGEERDLEKEATGDLEYIKQDGPLSLDALAEKEGVEPEDLERFFEGIRGDLTHPVRTRDHVYLFRVLETIEDDTSFEDVREKVEKDAAADTEKAVRRAYDRDPDRFRRPFEVDAEVLLADISRIVEETADPAEPEVKLYYNDHREVYALPEADPETGSRYVPFDDVRAGISEGLRRKKARERGNEILEALAAGAGEASLKDLLARAEKGDRAMLRLIPVESMDAEGAWDHEEIGSARLALELEGWPAGVTRGPFEGVSGPYLFRVTRVRESFLPPLEEARPEVEQALVADRDDAVRGLYETGQRLYREQEKYEVEYLIARYKDYLPKTEEPTEDEIRESYEIRKKEFTLAPDETDPDRPEEEQVRPLEEVRDDLIEDLRWEDAAELATKDIEAAKEEIDKDRKKENLQDFEYYRVLSDRLVLERPDQPLDRTDLFNRDDLRSSAISRHVLQAKEGDTSDIVENDHREAKLILRLKKKIEARTKDLDEVIAEVEGDYFLGQATGIAEEVMESIRERVLEGASLREAAEEHGQSPFDSDFLGRDDTYLRGIASPARVIREVFRLEEGERLIPVVSDDWADRVLLAEVIEEEDPSPAGFPEKEAAIRSTLDAETQAEVGERWEAETLIRARGLGDEVLTKAYEENFRDRVRVRQILIGFDDTRAEVAMDEARERAERLWVRLLYFEPFAKLAARLSRDGGPVREGGKIVPQDRDQLAAVWGEEVARSVAATPVGSFTRPVRGEDGYHLFLVEERKGEAFHLRQITIQATPDLLPNDLTARAKGSAQEEAERARSRLQGGESFAVVALQVSDDPVSAPKGGDIGEIGYADRNRIPEEVVDAALGAETGEVSDLIQTAAGYTIIKVYARSEVPLDEVWFDVAAQVMEKNLYPYTEPEPREDREEEEETDETEETEDE